MVERNDDERLGFKRKCELLNVSRSSMYYVAKPAEHDDAGVLNAIRDIYTEMPVYGYRRIHVELRRMGFEINQKRVRRLLRLEGIYAIYPGKNTSIRNLEHKIYPYLLKDLTINRSNQVWAVDITYIRIRHGFVYLVCLIDIFSRKIMGWTISTSLDTGPCTAALEEALNHGTPEIVNSDQGCQFTSEAWTAFLIQRGIKISMDGKGRWVDNKYIERFWRTAKYESVFLHSFDTVDQARKTIDAYIRFYNQRRSHQSLNYHTPDEVYKLGYIPTQQQLFESFKPQRQAQIMEATMSL